MWFIVNIQSKKKPSNNRKYRMRQQLYQLNWLTHLLRPIIPPPHQDEFFFFISCWICLPIGDYFSPPASGITNILHRISEWQYKWIIIKKKKKNQETSDDEISNNKISRFDWKQFPSIHICTTKQIQGLWFLFLWI